MIEMMMLVECTNHDRLNDLISSCDNSYSDQIQHCRIVVEPSNAVRSSMLYAYLIVIVVQEVVHYVVMAGLITATIRQSGVSKRYVVS